MIKGPNVKGIKAQCNGHGQNLGFPKMRKNNKMVGSTF
jgi:hypothetical protein